MTTRTRHDLDALARRQHWLVTRRQLLDSGRSVGEVRHLLRTRRLHRVHAGVYAVGRPDLTREGRWLAAVLAVGDGALLSHLAAAALWGIVERGGDRPEVLVGDGSGSRSRRTFTVHRTSTLAAGDRARRSGVPVTSVPRTLIDVSACLDRRALRAAVRQAERLHRVDVVALRARVAAHPTNPSYARLHAVLGRLVPVTGLAESELETRFLELCARHRLPEPRVQVPVAGYRADFLWPHARLVVETDGRHGHDTHSAFLEDRVRDRALTAAGYEVLRFTWAEVVHRPADVAREVRGALRRRRVLAG